MQQMIADPMGFVAGGWHWLSSFVAHVDGRLALVAGVLAWFFIERAAGAVYDPLKKSVVVLLTVAAILVAGIAWGCFQTASGPVSSFEALWKTPNLDQYQQVK